MSFYFTNLRPAPLTGRQPEVRITQWRLVQLSDAAIVLVGVVPSVPDALTVRITTPVQFIDVANRTLQTMSGRIYVLVGDPASTPFMRAVIEDRLIDAGHADAADVTDAVWPGVLPSLVYM
jgi:hypothetical protein